MGIQLTGNKSVFLSLQWTGGSCMLKKMQAHCVLNILFSRLWASLVAQMIKNLQCRRLMFNLWVRKIPWKGNGYPLQYSWGFPGGSDGKDSAYKAGGLGLIPASVIFPIHSSILAWWIPWIEEPDKLHTVHEVIKSQTWRMTNTFAFFLKTLDISFMKHNPQSKRIICNSLPFPPLFIIMLRGYSQNSVRLPIVFGWLTWLQMTLSILVSYTHVFAWLFLLSTRVKSMQSKLQ